MRLAVLLSGRGSNFQAIHDAIQNGTLDAQIVCVISNRPDAPGIARARDYGYDAHVIDHKAFANRALHEAEVMKVLEAARPDYIALAGYMRLLSATFVERWRNRIINIHPSLLPKYPGVDTHKRCLEAGDLVHGCTVHQVTAGVDEGPAIGSAEIDVHPGDTEAT
ncbi:MAG TPA: phosphoribosylglycinamide formyltransferase, partial [Thermoanaerobaculia bacterium]